MQEIVTSHIFLAVFFHSIYVSKQFCLITCSGMVIPPKVLLFLANQILQAIAMSLLVSARLGDDNAVFISICGIVGNCNRVQNWDACGHLNNMRFIFLTLSTLVLAYSLYAQDVYHRHTLLYCPSYPTEVWLCANLVLLLDIFYP